MTLWHSFAGSTILKCKTNRSSRQAQHRLRPATHSITDLNLAAMHRSHFPNEGQARVGRISDSVMRRRSKANKRRIQARLFDGMSVIKFVMKHPCEPGYLLTPNIFRHNIPQTPCGIFVQHAGD